MRRHVLFLVHGMGDNVGADGGIERDWHDRARATLASLYEQYRILGMVPFDERFEVVPIHYDAVFNDLISHWADQSAALKASGVPLTGIVERTFDWLDQGAQQDDNFAWTHVADVVLYRFFPLVRQRVKAHVGKSLLAALKPDSAGAVTSWSVISHSLGCVVTHDVLHAMDATTPGEPGISILDAMVPSATLVAMISNVSKVMENDISVYDSQVAPPTGIRPNTACFHYLNVNNRFDPFIVPERFDPKDDPVWKAAKQAKTFLDVRIDSVHEANTHSFANYLANPNCHIPLFEHVAGRGSISGSEKTAALESFRKVASDTLLDQAKQLLKNSRAPSWFEVVGRYFAFLRQLQRGDA